MDWLASTAFGFRERARQVAADGILGHGEMEAGEASPCAGDPFPRLSLAEKSSRNLRAGGKWSVVPYIVDGVLGTASGV